MRASFLMTAALALSLAMPAFADPAYNADKVVNFLLQSKAHKLGATRGLHLQDPAAETEASDAAAEAAPVGETRRLDPPAADFTATGPEAVTAHAAAEGVPPRPDDPGVEPLDDAEKSARRFRLF